MAINVRLSYILLDRHMNLVDLANQVNISVVNLSNLKTGKCRAIRFSTLNALCRVLNCQPGDLLEYDPMKGGVDEENGTKDK